MEALRTPDERFRALPDFPFAPHYVDVADGEAATLRVHYLDEGPPTARSCCCMHGEPSWSLPLPQDDPGPHRARASAASRPTSSASAAPTSRPKRDDYTYARHVEWMRAALFDDARPARRHARLPGLGRAHRPAPRRRAPRPLRARRHRQHVPADRRPARRARRSSAGRTSRRRSRTSTSASSSAWAAPPSPADDVIAAYNAPFPDDSYKAGARQFPMLVPTAPDDPASDANRKAWETLRGVRQAVPHRVLRQGPRSRAAATRAFQRDVPGCAGQPHTTIEGGGHFLQEDRGEELAQVVVDWLAGSSVAASTSSRCSTRSARIAQTGLHYATDPFDRERYEQLLDARDAGVRRAHRARRRRRARPVRTRPRLRHRQGRRRRRGLRRARPDPARAARRRRPAGDSIAGWVDAERGAGGDRRARDRRRGRRRARVDQLVGVFFRDARADEHPHSVVSVVYLCTVIGGELRPQLHEVREVAWRRSTRSRPDDWHHHHEQLARASATAGCVRARCRSRRRRRVRRSRRRDSASARFASWRFARAGRRSARARRARASAPPASSFCSSRRR